MAHNFDQVVAAGFDGLSIDLGALGWQQAEQAVGHFARTGLAAGLTAFPKSGDDLRRAMHLAHRINAPFLVVIGQDMPVPLPQMVAVVESWLRIAQQERMPIQFETHRNCITNDLYTTVQLLEQVPAMRLAADLSHYVVDREMPCPPTPHLQALVTELLLRAESFQGRVAARGQIQIPLDFPQNAKWLALFRGWWREGFKSWLLRHEPDSQPLVFLCELGPPDYALTDRAGQELSDRWLEALALAQWARETWEEIAGTTGRSPTPPD